MTMWPNQSPEPTWTGASQFRCCGQRHAYGAAQLFSLGVFALIMSFFKFTTDKTVKQIRWVMVFTIVFDKFCTLLGQPSSYWHHPETMREGNPFVRQFLGQGLTVYIAYSLVYIFLMVLLASTILRKLALVLIFYGIFAHYFAGCTWLVYRFHFGVNACGIYGIILGVVLVQLIFPKPANVCKEASSSNEPDA